MWSIEIRHPNWQSMFSRMIIDAVGWIQTTHSKCCNFWQKPKELLASVSGLFDFLQCMKLAPLNYSLKHSLMSDNVRHLHSPWVSNSRDCFSHRAHCNPDKLAFRSATILVGNRKSDGHLGFSLMVHGFRRCRFGWQNFRSSDPNTVCIWFSLPSDPALGLNVET